MFQKRLLEEMFRISREIISALQQLIKNCFIKGLSTYTSIEENIHAILNTLLIMCGCISVRKPQTKTLAWVLEGFSKCSHQKLGSVF